MKKVRRKGLYSFHDDGCSFSSHQATALRTIYAPLCGPKTHNLKSSITPFLSGDIKINKERFLTKPTSREDLRQNVRDFFVRVNDQVVSLAQPTHGTKSSVDIGPFWHRLVKRFSQQGLMLEAVNFIPSTGENVELMTEILSVQPESTKI